MSVTFVIRAFPVHVVGSTTLAAVLMLVAGLVGAASPVTAVAAAAGAAALLPAVAMVSLGMAVRVRTTRICLGCRCVCLLAMGVLAGGLTLAGLPLAAPALRSAVVAAGLGVAAVLFMAGLLQVPGLAAAPVARLRMAVDGLSIGSLLALAGWLVVPELGAHHPLAYVSTMIAASCAAIIMAVVLAAGRQRRAMIRCGVGAALAIAGLALLVGMLEPETPQWALLAAATLVVAGPPVIWAGARRVDFGDPVTGHPVTGHPVTGHPAPGRPAAEKPTAGSLDESFSGYPMLALPVGVAALATTYHLIAFGVPDHTAVLLSIGIGCALAVREVLAATDLRRWGRRLAVQEAHLRALVAGAGDVTMVLGEDLVVRWQSPAAHQLGLADQDVVGRRFPDLVHPHDAAVVADRLQAVVDGAVVPPVLVEARMVGGDGACRETESTLNDLRGVPAVGALVVQVRDIGRRRHLERSLHLLARTDQRTGLPNREELIGAIAARRTAGPQRGALVVIGLHGLTAVNDLRGRPAGDAVRIEAARRLRALVGADDVAASLGESQLAVVTGEGAIEAYVLAVRLVAALAGPYPLPGRPVQLQASAGLVALAAADSSEEVVHRGGLALRRADQQGRNQVEWYDESLEEKLVRRLDLERHLPGAAGRDELDLVYQPVVELDGERPVGVEALLRWRHPVLGRVLPGELMPIADKLRVSEEIGEWVLHAACRQVAAWRRDGYDLWLAVNVSARQLADPGLVPGLAAALSVHQTPPERLTVEISTAEVTDLPEVASQLGRVRGLGVRTALDDVGAGHTDLAWLRRLPLDVVKLVTSADPADGVAAGVVDLADKLGLTVVCEGLETEPQRTRVRAAGCWYGQGYLVSPPAPAERIEAYLAARDVEMRSAGSSSP